MSVWRVVEDFVDVFLISAALLKLALTYIRLCLNCSLVLSILNCVFGGLVTDDVRVSGWFLGIEVVDYCLVF